MSDKKYKVKIFKDNRLTITLHDFIPFKSSKPLPTTRPTTRLLLKNEYMSTKDYKRLLKSAYRKLWDKDFTQGYYVFVTLTLDGDLSYQRLLNDFHRFLIYVKRKYGKFEYIRAIELHKKIHRLHIHGVFQFKDKPTHINKITIEKLWGLGICDFIPVDDIWSVLQYLTKFKPQHQQKENPHLTYFLRGAKVVSTSQHFGTPLDYDSYKEDYISADHLNFILNHHFNEFFENNGKFVRVDSHRYFNTFKCEYDSCMDRVYIRTTKDFIDSNFDILNDENKPP